MGPCCSTQMRAGRSYIEQFLFSPHGAAESSRFKDGDGALLALPVPRIAQRPDFLSDEKSEICFGCGVPFSALRRRHHCRRCFNLFCATCTSWESKLLLYQASADQARVCEQCNRQAALENTFVEDHLPLLHRGSTMLRRGLLGSSTVFVRISGDLESLVCTQAGQSISQAGVVALKSFRDVQSVYGAPTCFTITLDSGHSIRLEASTEQEKKDWIDALRTASRVASKPRLKDEVEADRERRQEMAKQSQYEAEKRERRMEREAFRNKVAEKYGISRFNGDSSSSSSLMNNQKPYNITAAQ